MTLDEIAGGAHTCNEADSDSCDRCAACIAGDALNEIGESRDAITKHALERIERLSEPSHAAGD